MADSPQDDGPFGKSTTASRDGLDADTKSFLDVARMEAEGYTDETVDRRLGDWDAAKLNVLAAAQTNTPPVPSTDGLRRLLMGGFAVLAIALIGLGIWAKGQLDATADAVAAVQVQSQEALTTASDTNEELQSIETQMAATTESIDGLGVRVSATEWDRSALAGQLQAQAACIGVSGGLEGWVTAVPRSCDGNTVSCDQICSNLHRRTQDKQLKEAAGRQCFNALHIYANGTSEEGGVPGFKTYKYQGCSNTGCGPNYCCCHSR